MDCKCASKGKGCQASSVQTRGLGFTETELIYRLVFQPPEQKKLFCGGGAIPTALPSNSVNGKIILRGSSWNCDISSNFQDRFALRNQAFRSGSGFAPIRRSWRFAGERGGSIRHRQQDQDVQSISYLPGRLGSRGFHSGCHHARPGGNPARSLQQQGSTTKTRGIPVPENLRSCFSALPSEFFYLAVRKIEPRESMQRNRCKGRESPSNG